MEHWVTTETDAPEPRPLTTNSERREAVEKIVAAGAEGGYLQARYQRWFWPRRARFHRPLIEWNDNSEPSIIGWAD